MCDLRMRREGVALGTCLALVSACREWFAQNLPVRGGCKSLILRNRDFRIELAKNQMILVRVPQVGSATAAPVDTSKNSSVQRPDRYQGEVEQLF